MEELFEEKYNTQCSLIGAIASRSAFPDTGIHASVVCYLTFLLKLRRYVSFHILRVLSRAKPGRRYASHMVANNSEGPTH